MKLNIKEIIPFVGIGDLKFGMTRDQVKNLLGEPSEVDNVPGFEEESVNDDLESWHYDQYEFSVVFDAMYEWKLVSISISDPHFTLFGKSVIGADKIDTLALLESKGYSPSATEDVQNDEDGEEDIELYEFEDLAMMIWCIEDEVIELQILPDVEEDSETIKWPD
jgi:hypothetical protein